MAEALLELTHVSKRWPLFRLEDACLSLPGGMIMGLVGANGAGKSTLIKLVLGLVRPDSGRIRLAGRDLAGDGAEFRRHIAYVPDEPRFAPELPLRSLMAVQARFYRDFDPLRWAALMAEFGLDPAAKAGQLSLGMRTKFALTLALAREAELLLLDEPTTGLDPEFRRTLLLRLAGLIQDESRSILFSTHITSDLERGVDLVTLMQDGQIRFSQDQEALRDNWVLVKGGLELLDDPVRAGFQGLRSTPYGFEALCGDGQAARLRYAGKALVEPASLEDIVVLMGRRKVDAA